MHPTAPSTEGNPPTDLEPESPFSPFESAGQLAYSTESPDKPPVVALLTRVALECDFVGSFAHPRVSVPAHAHRHSRTARRK
jgi:hypothetical protein